MGILSVIIGATLLYALLPLLLSPCFSWGTAKKELARVLGAWKRRSYACCVCKRREGFTLIELSVVLVIIGLIVGGVLTGRDLIKAAALRAQITQIERFNTAVNTFRVKYSYLPGDIPAAAASAAGLQPRGPYPGQGDGDGIIEGNCANNPNNNTGTTQSAGETAMFWVDLSAAGLISGAFNTATETAINSSANITGAALNAWFPQAAIGQGNYVLVMGGTGGGTGYMNFSPATGPNYFEVEGVTLLGNGINGTVNYAPSMTVQQAYAIDNKIDDGRPTSGRVLSVNLGSAAVWGTYDSGPPSNGAIPNNAGTCYNNGAVAGATSSYSLNYGNSVACNLAFQFQ